MDDLIERARSEVDLRKRMHGDDRSNWTRADRMMGELLIALEAAREDAERWRHARKLLTIDDIEGAQCAYESFGRLISEDECKRADAAIDAARDAEIERLRRMVQERDNMLGRRPCLGVNADGNPRCFELVDARAQAERLAEALQEISELDEEDGDSLRNARAISRAALRDQDKEGK